MLSIDLAITILRVVIGLFFFGHGAQKLFGWFGGAGLSGTTEWFQSMGLNPPKFWALVAGLCEFIGGIGLVFGFLTPIAAAAIIGVMLGAIAKVHWVHGLWVSNNGIEHPLLNLLYNAFLALYGPGRYALDSYLNINYPMPLTFLIALAVFVVGVLISLITTRLTAQAQPRSA